MARAFKFWFALRPAPTVHPKTSTAAVSTTEASTPPIQLNSTYRHIVCRWVWIPPNRNTPPTFCRLPLGLCSCLSEKTKIQTQKLTLSTDTICVNSHTNKCTNIRTNTCTNNVQTRVQTRVQTHAPLHRGWTSRHKGSRWYTFCRLYLTQIHQCTYTCTSPPRYYTWKGGM